MSTRLKEYAMDPLHVSVNPFVLLLDPQAIVSRIERSERLERLHRRVCRPLDKPLLAPCGEAAETSAHDRAIDDAAESE
jgi:hypothetical protein